MQQSGVQGQVQSVDSPTQVYLAPDVADGAGQSGSLLPDIDIRTNLQKVVTDQVEDTVRDAFMTANPLAEGVPGLEPTPLTEERSLETAITLPQPTSYAATAATAATPGGQTVAPPTRHSDGEAAFGTRLRPISGGYLPPPRAPASAPASADSQAASGVG